MAMGEPLSWERHRPMLCLLEAPAQRQKVKLVLPAAQIYWARPEAEARVAARAAAAAEIAAAAVAAAVPVVELATPAAVTVGEQASRLAA